jgi:hypothetical protein
MTYIPLPQSEDWSTLWCCLTILPEAFVQTATFKQLVDKCEFALSSFAVAQQLHHIRVP